MPILSIVIPVYNEENYIAKTIDRVLSQPIGKLQKELIIVDDGSIDFTLKKIHSYFKSKKFSQKKSKNITYFKKQKISVKFIQMAQNQGKGLALKMGFSISTGDIVLVQDADLEYSPKDYPLILRPFLEENVDVVFGSRFISHAPHRVLYYWHSLGNRFLTNLSNMFTNLNLTDMETGFKAFRGDLIRKIAPQLRSARFGFEPEITARIAKIKGIQIYEVGISYSGRTYAEGKKIQWKDGLLALCQILKYNFSIKYKSEKFQ